MLDLSVTSPLPYFLISGLFLLVSSGLLRLSHFHRHHIDSEVSRFQSIDGLRGFLALAVFFHHAVIFYYFYRIGKWDTPPSVFYTLLGQVGVSLFFMISGLLFWSKAITSRGKINPIKLLVSRVKRLAPMYTASVVLVFIVAFAVSGFVLKVPLLDVVRSGAYWMSFGFKMFPPDINGVKDSWIINSVYWSLAYEWLFYLVLPLLAVAYRDVAFLILSVLLSVLILFGTQLVNVHLHPILLSFVFGALTAWLIEKDFVWLLRLARSRLASLSIVLILSLLFWRLRYAYTWQAGLMLFVVFFIIAAGNNLFGLLTSRPARLLGALSYSTYLLHTPILYLLLHVLNQVTPVSQMGALLYWAVIALAGGLLVLLSGASFRWIEHPFMPKRR